jgi:glycine/D-amino acid oxidase-like deaminating enzyme
VRIFEGSPVVRFRARPTPVAQTPGGSVRAGRAVLGVNAWALNWRAFHRALIVRGTSIVITAPAPERLEEIAWTGGEGVYDVRTTLHYLRATPDGRIAFGGAGMRTSTRSRVDGRFDADGRGVRELVRDLRRWFPTFADVPLEASWGGPIDASALHLPFFGTMPGGRVHYGLGFTGNGVGPCHLGGKILSGLALDVEDAYTTLPIVGAEPKRFPRDALLVPGERIVVSAIMRKDRLEEEGRRPGPLTDALAHLPRRLGYRLGP